MNIKIESHYIPVYDNIKEEILSYGDELKRTSPVRADHTRWQLQDENRIFDKFIDTFHEIYPKYKINELWGCTYRQDDYAEAHNHFGFDLAFVWFVDTCSHCSPLIFPDIKHPWLDHEAVIEPRNGMLYVFTGKDIHYVEPHTCEHPRIIMSGNVRRSINTTVSPIDNPWQ
tara:strand:- start:195 stop:707 length:513 start_codon:yes stop_codon:yes gene_type:complete